jgi:hypothetical protein
MKLIAAVVYLVIGLWCAAAGVGDVIAYLNSGDMKRKPDFRKRLVGFLVCIAAIWILRS